MKHIVFAGLVAALLCLSPSADALARDRAVPRPLPSHPGNLFLVGEEAVVPIPAGTGQAWRVLDYEGKPIAQIDSANGCVRLKGLSAGYYEIVNSAAPASNYISFGILEPLRAPTPVASPVGIDVAMAWFFPPEKMDSVASLCALAGVNRVRDRLTWGEIEPARSQFSTTNRYDTSARSQAAAGLQVLQVGHSSPRWANSNGKRFPLDLRDAYNFHRAIAARWKGQVLAFEPWNEADIPMFGGHTGSEIASFQKASYLGLKAGNPHAIACLNVFAIHRLSTLHDFQANEVWPFFDTFNLHHYEPFASYPRLYADFRSVSAGKPLWVSECSVPVKWQGDDRLKEPSREDLRVQSERVPMVFAQSIHEGAQAVFYFMLPHYVEGQTQFGILRPDLTPRPAFLALAAAGRLLADAQPLGRLQTATNSVHGYLFRARPDGKRADVLVIWSEAETEFELPRPPSACLDHLGRLRPSSGSVLKLGRAPLFVILNSRTPLALDPPPKPPELLPGKASPIVFQALLPEETIDLEKSAYKLESGREITIPVFAYNFGSKPAHGQLSVSVPEAWHFDALPRLELAPGERKQVALRLTPPGKKDLPVAAIRISGNFRGAGRPVLSLLLYPMSSAPANR